MKSPKKKPTPESVTYTFTWAERRTLLHALELAQLAMRVGGESESREMATFEALEDKIGDLS